MGQKRKSHGQIKLSPVKKKSREDEGGYNQDLCRLLEEMSRYERVVNRDVMRAQAYLTAVHSLATHRQRVRSRAEAMTLTGIGRKIGEKIGQYIETGETGHISQLDVMRSDDAGQVMLELCTIHGIGPSLAHALVSKHGVTSVQDLTTGRFHHLLTPAQRLGLRYRDEFSQAMSRSEVERVVRVVRDVCHRVDEAYEVEAVGSYRRGAEESGDVDLVLTHQRYLSTHGAHPQILGDVVRALADRGFITDTMALGTTRFMGVCKLGNGGLHRRLDMTVVPCDQYHCAILHFTGSGEFNRAMRAEALQAGYSINEHSIRKVLQKKERSKAAVLGPPLPVYREKDIFDYIRKPYIHPHKRNL